MVNLMQQGLALQAASIPQHDAQGEVARLVRGTELFRDVFLEAIEQGAFVFSNGRRTIIARTAPAGYTKIDSAFIHVMVREGS